MGTKTPVTISFLILCVLVSVPSVFSTNYFEVFNSELPHEYWWQQITMPFQHGAKGAPLAILGHLALNMILLVACGVLAEKMLGSARMLALTIATWLVFYFTQKLSGIWINGSSGIIWAYTPFLLQVINWGKTDERFEHYAERSKRLLVVMWGIVTVLMGFLPLLFNPNHSLLDTFFFGNLFHFSATMTGFVFFLVWRNSLAKERLLK